MEVVARAVRTRVERASGGQSCRMAADVRAGGRGGRMLAWQQDQERSVIGRRARARHRRTDRAQAADAAASRRAGPGGLLADLRGGLGRS